MVHELVYGLLSDVPMMLYYENYYIIVFLPVMVTFISYTSHACQTYSGMAERLQHTNYSEARHMAPRHLTAVVGSNIEKMLQPDAGLSSIYNPSIGR